VKIESGKTHSSPEIIFPVIWK